MCLFYRENARRIRRLQTRSAIANHPHRIKTFQARRERSRCVAATPHPLASSPDGRRVDEEVATRVIERRRARAIRRRRFAAHVTRTRRGNPCSRPRRRDARDDDDDDDDDARFGSGTRESARDDLARSSSPTRGVRSRARSRARGARRARLLVEDFRGDRACSTGKQHPRPWMREKEGVRDAWRPTDTVGGKICDAGSV